MTENDLHAFLSRLSYKPGTRFRLGELEPEGFYWLRIIQRVQNAYPPYDMISIEYPVKIVRAELERATPDLLIKRITKWLTDMENHELQEWLKFDNRRIYTTHPERKKTTGTERRGATVAER